MMWHKQVPIVFFVFYKRHTWCCNKIIIDYDSTGDFWWSKTVLLDCDKCVSLFPCFNATKCYDANCACNDVNDSDDGTSIYLPSKSRDTSTPKFSNNSVYFNKTRIIHTLSGQLLSAKLFTCLLFTPSNRCFFDYCWKQSIVR